MTWCEDNPFAMGIISAIIVILGGAIIFGVNSSNSLNPNWDVYWGVVSPTIGVLFVGGGFVIKKHNEKDEKKKSRSWF